MATPIYSIDDETFRDACISAHTWAEVLRTLGLSKSGSAYRAMKRRADQLAVPHPAGGKAWAMGLKRPGQGFKPMLLEAVLVENSPWLSSAARVKQKMIDAGLIEDRCLHCGVGPEWQGDPLTLHLDHKNGDSRDYRLENLRVLCPNCHSQTPTFGFKKRV